MADSLLCTCDLIAMLIKYCVNVSRSILEVADVSHSSRNKVCRMFVVMISNCWSNAVPVKL